MQQMLGKELKNSSLLKLQGLIFMYFEGSNSLLTGSYTLLSYNSITNEGRDHAVITGATPCNTGTLLASVEQVSLMSNHFLV